MIKRILWILLLACFLTGCGPQSAVPTVGAQETPVPTTEPTAQQFESESLTEATPVLEAKQTEMRSSVTNYATDSELSISAENLTFRLSVVQRI